MRAARSLPTLLSLALLGLVAGAQQAYDAASQAFVGSQRERAVTFAQPFIPSANALRLLSLGDAPVAADLVWLQSIQYFGTGNPYGTYASLGSLLDRVTSLDPQFEYPYEFGLVVLPYMRQADAAVTLGLRAQQALPDNGLLTYYLATVYHLNLKDYANAAKYYQKASTEPGAPGAARTLAGVALTHVDSSLQDRQAALAYWQTVYEHAQNDQEKDIAKGWLENTQIAYGLEQAAQTYKERQGRYPASFQELLDAKLIPSLPDSPTGRSFSLDPATGRVSF